MPLVNSFLIVARFPEKTQNVRKAEKSKFKTLPPDRARWARIRVTR
jgi:hypothetical protein